MRKYSVASKNVNDIVQDKILTTAIREKESKSISLIK